MSSTPNTSAGISDAITTAAGDPLRVKDPSVEVQAHNLKDLIAADIHIRNMAARDKRAGKGPRVQPIGFGKPGGA